MNNKKVLINVICASLILRNIIPGVAAVIENDSSSYQNAAEDTKETEVLYTKSASYFVTIPRTITLGSNKLSQYSVKVEGDIPSDKQVYVSPIDDITETNNFDFYMKDQNTKNSKGDVVATVTQSKFYWDFQDVANAYTETNNQVEAAGLTAGTWKGTFDFEINMHNVENELYQVAPTEAVNNWNYILDETNNAITLKYYTGSESDVIVYANYVIGEKTYKTQLANNVDEATSETPYMFNGWAQTSCQKIESIKFSESIDTGNITNMEYMFSGCKSLTNLDVLGLDTSNVTNMNWMFNDCDALVSLDVSAFNTSNVTNMYQMFSGCKALTALDVTGFNTSKVMDMSYMFYNCTSLASLDLSSFDTSNVTNMRYMFYGCKSLFSLDLSSFDTSNVTNIEYMFRSCRSLVSLDLSSFYTSKVTKMIRMFYDCNSLTNIIVLEDKWIISKGCDTTDMFYSCGTDSVTYK